MLVATLLLFSGGWVFSENPPVLNFTGNELVFSEKEAVIDFGEVKQGELCVVSIGVKNSSRKILHIANIRGSCALSIPSWPRKNLEPGEEGVIQVRYDSSRPGPFNRHLTIHANTDTSVTVLKIKGVIIP